MKLYILFCIMAVTPSESDDNHVAVKDSFDELDGNAIINELMRVLFVYIRQVIHNGSKLLGIPRLDPYELEEYHLQVPAGPIKVTLPYKEFNSWAPRAGRGCQVVHLHTLGISRSTGIIEVKSSLLEAVQRYFNLNMKNSIVSGLSTFVVHRNNLALPDLTFDMDISIPRIDVSTELYDLTGVFANTTTLPFYGNGKARFVLEGYRLQAKLYLKQSDNGKSLVIDKIEGASFEIPGFESKIEGTIGDSAIDPAVNSFVEELVTSYVNRFSSAIANLGSTSFINFTNPILEQMNTWRFIAPFS